MTAMTSPDIYDENSVFRKLFTDEPKPKKPTPTMRLAQVFGETCPFVETSPAKPAAAPKPPANAEAPNSEPPIKVSDFLPRF